ncbi:hypothetical protein D0861_04961 [Hortaea werneckii]|uniref:COX assembly mitochondrial protein n=2 Tax=Hortaea werneckii TaxID=91943 RepID=A0A3M7FIQ3_HORWE|nr:hypothetical protein BTJ68_01218 [Hortaea werneckii EXF-2000]RMY88154.1 hypothetical protein D0861_04961 [Hortaea werneckii]RMZ28359.1 hypothetical protein D0859_07563 [Hortaea werneckii]
MATSMTSQSPADPPAKAPALSPSRQPLPLSASQESQVRELYHKRVRNKCADEVRDFASCAMNHTFTATIMCRKEQKAMNTCMMKYANQAEMDAARAEWFATIDQRKQQREEKEEKRKKDEVFWRQWWDKDLSKKPGEAGEGK